MTRYGKIIVIKRDGTDGLVYPLTSTSCLFGRKTECDIRMRLPWVSNEHCKIEINENKEAVLINLSTVNPTQLNGVCLEQPVPLKHRDVLTIIDRSFRFEYPLQSTPRKRHSRSPEGETLQILHVQQVAQVELLHQQTSRSKSLGASGNAECEEKIANENKQTTGDTVPKALPVKLNTPKSSQRIYRVIQKQTELSPFSKLYESLKNEVEVKKPLPKGNASQQAAREDGERVVPKPNAQIPLSGCVDVLDKGKERGRRENTEECVIVRCFSRSPQNSLSQEVSRGTGQSHLQDPKELSAPGQSKGVQVIPSKENHGNPQFGLPQCSIECLECPAKEKIRCSATRTPNGSGADGGVVSTPTSRRKSLRALVLSPGEAATGVNAGNADTPTSRRRLALKPRSLSGIAAEAPRADPDIPQLPFPENGSLKQRRSSKAHPATPAQNVLTEISDQANLVNSKVGHPETPAALSSSKSSRRNSRQSREFSDKSVHLETLASEELMASPAAQEPGSGRKRGRPRSSGMLMETAQERNTVQEHPGENRDRKESGAPAEPAMEGGQQEQGLEGAGAARPRRLSAKGGSAGSAPVLRDSEAAPETNTCGLLDGEDSGETKKLCQKRKSGDLLPQTVGKRKRVSFGGHLSPELFDKSLPPNSPLKRGALPARRSLPCGTPARVVLKKAQGLQHSADQQEEKLSPRGLAAQKSPAGSCPASGLAVPRGPPGSPAPLRRGRFSISQLPVPFPIPEEKESGAQGLDTQEKSGVRVKTPPSSPTNQGGNTPVTATPVTATPAKLTRSAQGGLKGTPLKRRSGAVGVLRAQRRSGASSANLLVAKSWAEVVKLGVARPQSKAAKKSVRGGRPPRRMNKPPKTPEKQIKGHFSTGHAESPATIVVGRAYSTTLRSAGHVPKVVTNPILKLNMNMDESFTGVPEMLQTPQKRSGKALPLAAAQNADFTPTCAAGEDISDLHTPEECGEMMVSPLNSSDASEQKQESPGICHLLREKPSLSSVFDEIPTETPEKRKAVQEDAVSVDGLSAIPGKRASLVKSGSKRGTPRRKLEPVEVVSGIKQLLRTPQQRAEAAEVLSGIKQLLRTPKRTLEPEEVLSGIKQLLRTPKRTLEPEEVLSGIKQLMKTPMQKSEPAEVLSGIKQLLRTPKRKPEPVEVLSAIKQLLRTPKQKLEPAENLSGIKQLLRTPRQKPEPVEDLSGIKQLLRTPKHKLDPADYLSGIKQLVKTPKQKSEHVEVLSGIKQLMRTPKQKPEPEEVLSGIKQLMRTPKQKPEPEEVLSGIKQLMRTPKQKPEPEEVLSGIKQLMRTPKQKPEPVEDLSGIKQLVRTPKQKPEPEEVLSGIKELLRTPKQKLEPAEVLSGIKQLMRTPKQKPEPMEDLSGIKLLMRTPQQETEPVTDEIALKRLLKTPVQRRGAVGGVKESPKLKYPPVEDMVGLSRIFRTPKEKGKPVESMFGISRLVRSPRQKQQPVEDFVGLPRLMAEPRQKWDCEVDYDGMTEMFDTPEEMEVTSVNVTDSQQDPAPPYSNSSHKYENKGKISQGEDSQQKESPSEKQSPQRQKRGRPRKTVHPAPAKQCEKDGNAKELQSLDTTSTQEGVGTIPSENKGRGRRRKCSLQEVVTKHPDQEPHGATQRPGRGKRKALEEVKPPSDNPESCVKDSSVPQKEAANRKQSLQECGTDGTLEAEGDPATETGSGHTQSENCHLQTGVTKPDSTSTDSGLEDSEEVLLSPRKRAGGAQSTELLIPPKRGRRCRNDQVKQDAPAELPGTTRRLPRDSAAQGRQRDEQASDKDPGAGTAEEPENETKLQVKVAEKRVKSLRSTRTRRHSGGVAKADTCGVTLENTQTILKTEETSAQADTEAQSHIKNEMEVSQGYETQNAQEMKTEASHRIKAESPSGETNKMPVTALNLEENRSAVQERSRTRNRRGKKDSLEQKADEFTNDGNNPKLIPAKFNSGTEVDESLKEDQPSPAATSAPAATSDSPAPGHQKRTRNQQGTLKPKETEILQENPAQGKGVVCRRGRGRKVHFELREASSKEVAGKRSLPEDGKGMTDNNQHENSENPSQARRGRRRQVGSVPQTATPAFVEKQTLTADHSKDEASVKEQDSAVEGTPCSAEANPPRRGRRREAAVASQAPRSPSVRTRRGLLGGGDKKMPVREDDENPALGNQTLQAKASASARDKRRKIDPAAEAKSSAPLQRKGGLLESDAKGEGTNEEQSMPLETESCAEEKPLGRGRRKEAVLASHTTSPVSLRGKRGLRADTSREEAPKAEESVPLETWDSSVKENQLRRGRRKTIALLEATGPKQGEQDPSKQSTRKSNYREAKQVILGNSSLENRDLSKENLRKTVTSVAFSSTSPQGLPEEHKNGAPEEFVEGAPSAKENPSRVSRRKTTSISEEIPSTSLREKPNLPKGRGQKGVLGGGEATPAENNSCQGRTRQVRNNRRKVQLMLESATSLSENSELPGNGNALETENLCVTSTGFEGGNLSGKGKDRNPTHQVVSASKRKCQLPADDLAPKKLKSGNDGNGSVGRAKRKKTEELGKENVRAAQTSGITERKTRSSTRTRK